MRPQADGRFRSPLSWSAFPGAAYPVILAPYLRGDSMRIVAGPFRPALERAFQETFARLRAADPLAPLAVVAPSGRVADHLKRLALDVLPQGFAGVRFYNLFSFARAIYHEETVTLISRLMRERGIPVVYNSFQGRKQGDAPVIETPK